MCPPDDEPGVGKCYLVSWDSNPVSSFTDRIMLTPGETLQFEYDANLEYSIMCEKLDTVDNLKFTWPGNENVAYGNDGAPYLMAGRTTGDSAVDPVWVNKVDLFPNGEDCVTFEFHVVGNQNSREYGDCSGYSFKLEAECQERCEGVDFACAKCGQVLECYVEADYMSEEYHAAVDYIEGPAFCDGFKTQCGGQQCGLEQGLTVYPIGRMDQKCPVLYHFQCKAGAAGGKGAGLSNWATYHLSDCVGEKSLDCSEKCDDDEGSRKCGCTYGDFCKHC